MSRAFITQVIQESTELSGIAARRATGDLIHAIVRQLKITGRFTLPGFGTFKVAKTRARKGLNPRTGDPVRVRAGKTVRFKVSPVLRKSV